MFVCTVKAVNVLITWGAIRYFAILHFCCSYCGYLHVAVTHICFRVFEFLLLLLDLHLEHLLHLCFHLLHLQCVFLALLCHLCQWVPVINRINLLVSSASIIKVSLKIIYISLSSSYKSISHLLSGSCSQCVFVPLPSSVLQTHEVRVCTCISSKMSVTNAGSSLG